MQIAHNGRNSHFSFATGPLSARCPSAILGNIPALTCDAHATCTDFCEVFRRNTTQLYLLAFLLTGNHPEHKSVSSPR